MSNYLRPRIAGASIFFTVRLSYGHAPMLVDHVDSLRDAVRRTKAERPFDIDAWVVLPDHIHAVWTLPPDDHDYSTRWSVIKARFSRSIPMTARRKSHEMRRERGIWQRRFWEHHLRNTADRDAAIRHCLHNPVKHGYVTDAKDWRWSSIHRDIRIGRYAA